MWHCFRVSLQQPKCLGGNHELVNRQVGFSKKFFHCINAIGQSKGRFQNSDLGSELQLKRLQVTSDQGIYKYTVYKARTVISHLPTILPSQISQCNACSQQTLFGEVSQVNSSALSDSPLVLQSQIWCGCLMFASVQVMSAKEITPCWGDIN